MNVQQTIIKGIRELLFVHNYLVLPGFGGFVLKATPARFGSSGAQLLPASKTVGFNAQLRQNDGILALWLQEKLNCSAAEALQHLNDFTAYCSGLLTARRRLSLDHIGFFYLDFENNTRFEPQADANFLSDSFGLGPVSIRELEEPVAEPKREPVFTDRVVATEPAPQPQAKPARSFRAYRRAMVPMLFSMLLFCLLLLFVSNTRFSGNLRASVFGHGAVGTYQPLPYPDLTLSSPSKKAFTYVADANGIASLKLGEETALAVTVSENVIPGMIKSDASSVKRRSGNFEIVLGCFTIQENAQRMVGKLSRQHRISAAISGRNDKGMYIVSDGHFATRDAAIERLQAIKNDFPNAWIKKQD